MKQEATPPAQGNSNTGIQVSVLVPVFNTGKCLQRCLDTLAAQDCVGIEVICINDGSTDQSGNILERQAAVDKRFRVIHQANGGYGKAMNQGLSVAKGTYIGIVEPDDWVESDMFSHLLKLAQTTNADIAKANYGIERKKQSRTNDKFRDIDEGASFIPTELPEYLRGSPSIWSAIYRTDWLREHNIRFSETPGAAFQDLGFSIRTWLAARSIALTRYAPYHYWEDNPTSSSRKMEDGAWAAFRELQLLSEVFAGIPEKESLVRSHIVFRIFSTLRADYRLRIRNTVKSFLLKYSHMLNDHFPLHTLNREVFTRNEWYDLQLIYNAPLTFPRKSKTRVNTLQRIISYRKEANHHVFRLLGMTLMMKRKRPITSTAPKRTYHKFTAKITQSVPDAQNRPDVSVIVPVYNAEAFLARCLKSLTESSLQSLEIICINDGSTDSSDRILQDWAGRDPRIRIFSQKNAGVSAARNLGLQHVTGHYLAFVDADDEVTPEYLSNMYTAAVKYNADLVVCGYRQYNAQGKYKAISQPFRHFPQLSPEELMKLPASVCSHLYATKVLQTPDGTARFPLGVRYGEDTAFHYSLYPQCRRAVQIEENGYIIYYTEGSSNSKAATVVFDMLQATAWLASQYKQHPKSPELTECIVRYASHALRRIHSLGLHNKQKAAAATLREILLKEGITPHQLQSLKKRDAALLTSILNGGNGLNLSYYFKRLKKRLKRLTH
ncbi:MAG: glycosyltransferase [Akkermansia sp.]|nr:glycosyltransferase [Akkermansia sp.]